MQEAVATGIGVMMTATLTDFARGHQLALTRFAFLLSGDRQHAEDVVQDVLTAMFRRFGDTLPLDHPGAYARAAIVNTHLSRTRRKSSHETPAGISEFPGTPIAGDRFAAPGLAEAIGERQVLLTALSRLPARSRAAVILRFYEDLTVADVAAALGCREGTAASLLSRAVATLRIDATLGAQQ